MDLSLHAPVTDCFAILYFAQVWDGFAPQRSLGEVFGASGDIHDLIRGGFVILDWKCVCVCACVVCVVCMC